MKLSYRELFSSRIDYPQADLPKDLWNKTGEEYELKEEIATGIENMAVAILTPKFKDAEKWIVTYLLGSSIATQFWKDDSDIDIKVVIEPDKFVAANPQYEGLTVEQLKEVFLEVFDQHKNKPYFKLLNRPLDMYMYSDDEIYTKEFQKKYDALYDVISKRWIKNPIFYDIDTYDRDDVVEEGERMALEWAEKWDLDLGKIRRKVKEAELIDNYIKTLDGKRAKKLKEKIENLLFAIQQDIKKLHTEKNYIKEEYYQAYEDYNPDIEKFYDSVNALPEVIQIKMLNLWGYIYIIGKLNDFIKDDGDLDRGEIKQVKEVLKNQVP